MRSPASMSAKERSKVFMRFFPKKPDPPGTRDLERIITAVEVCNVSVYVTRTGIGVERIDGGDS